MFFLIPHSCLVPLFWASSVKQFLKLPIFMKTILFTKNDLSKIVLKDQTLLFSSSSFLATNKQALVVMCACKKYINRTGKAIESV